MLGTGAVDAVRGLVDQSLLSVRETPAGVRYRMLETVREFGRMRLAAAGGGRRRAAQRGWAAPTRALGRPHAGASQFEAIDALAAEETNLADELRGAIAGGDPGTVVQLLAGLGMFWTMRGEHLRLLLVAGGRRCHRRLVAAPGPGDATRATMAIS